MYLKYSTTYCVKIIISIFLTSTVLRRDLLDESESPQGLPPTTLDADLGVNILSAEGYLDGPYDFGYSRIEKYMDTSSAYGMKAQTLSFVPGYF